MGQTTYAVLLGVRMAPPKTEGDDDTWNAWEENYKPAKGLMGPDHPCGDGRDYFDGIGFWCAVGASGKDGVPYLAGFPLDDFGGANPKFAAALKKAMRSWNAFAAWAAEPHAEGELPAVRFPEPRLYLVMTEVS